jgi:hypothetical protein
MPLVTTRRRFTRGSSPASQIELVARAVLAELDDPDSEASRAARRAGLTPADLDGARIEVAEGEQGAEPILTSIVIGIISAGGARMAESLWVDVLWPRIRRRLGADALGDPATQPDAGV